LRRVPQEEQIDFALQPAVPAEGWSDADIDRPIKQAQHEVEPVLPR
jgi:hypothetical protein